jgi:hypothetical protein
MLLRWEFYGLALLAILAASHRTVAAEPAPKADFAVEEKSDRLIITDGGKLVAEYVFSDPIIKRPYYRHVHTPSGIQVTRNHPPVAGKDLDDHPTFHPGIWWGFGDINGEDFWRNKGTIRHERMETFVRGTNDSPNIFHYCSLVDSVGTRIAKVRFTMIWIRKILPPSKQSSYLLYYNVSVESDDRELAFGDQEEMGLGVRLASPLAEKNGGVVTSEGPKTGAKAIWGTTARWCDYSGRIGENRVGVTMVAPIDPCWWHVRDYGLMVANDFGKRARPNEPDPVIRIKPGSSVDDLYHIIIHDDPDYDPAQVVAPMTKDD